MNPECLLSVEIWKQYVLFWKISGLAKHAVKCKKVTIYLSIQAMFLVRPARPIHFLSEVGLEPLPFKLFSS